MGFLDTSARIRRSLYESLSPDLTAAASEARIAAGRAEQATEGVTANAEFRLTLAAAVKDFTLGTFFTSRDLDGESQFPGVKRQYQIIATPPYWADRGAWSDAGDILVDRSWTLKDKLDWTRDLKSFGRTGFGDRDQDTAVFSEAIEWLNSFPYNITGDGARSVRPILTVSAGHYFWGDLPTLMVPYAQIDGVGKDAVLGEWSGTHGLFEHGVFEEHPEDPFVSNGGQGLRLRGMTLLNPAGRGFDKAGTRAGFAVRDNGGGDMRLTAMRIIGFGYGVCGSYGSDFTLLRDVQVRYCDVAGYFGPGTQQFHVNEMCQFTESLVGLALDSVLQGTIANNHFGNNGMDICLDTSVGVPTRLGCSSTKMTATKQYQVALSISDNYFETGAGAQSTGYDHVCHIGVNKLGSDMTVQGVTVIRPKVISGDAGFPQKNPAKVYSYIDATWLSVQLLEPTIFGTRNDVVINNANTATYPQLLVRNALFVGPRIPIFAQPSRVNAVERRDTSELFEMIGGAPGIKFTDPATGRYDVIRGFSDGTIRASFYDGLTLRERFRVDQGADRIFLGDRSAGLHRSLGWNISPATNGRLVGDIDFSRTLGDNVGQWKYDGANGATAHGPGMLATSTQSFDGAAGATNTRTFEFQIQRGIWDIVLTAGNGDWNHTRFERWTLLFLPGSANTLAQALHVAGQDATSGNHFPTALTVTISATGLVKVTVKSTTNEFIRLSYGGVRLASYSALPGASA